MEMPSLWAPDTLRVSSRAYWLSSGQVFTMWTDRPGGCREMSNEVRLRNRLTRYRLTPRRLTQGSFRESLGLGARIPWHPWLLLVESRTAGGELSRPGLQGPEDLESLRRTADGSRRFPQFLPQRADGPGKLIDRPLERADGLRQGRTVRCMGRTVCASSTESRPLDQEPAPKVGRSLA